MATMTSGVFPVNNLKIMVSKVGENKFVPIADMENAEVAIETGVEEWFTLDSGWKKGLATSKSFMMTLAGKRHIGDAGNDLIAGKWNAMGEDALVDVQVGFPNNEVLTFKAIVSVTSIWGAEGTAVAPLEFELIAEGKPELA